MKKQDSEGKHIERILDEENDNYSNDDLYNISSWGADFSFRELVQMYDESSLLKPELQRKYVWDKSEASKFIDSILLGLPVPSIFLAKTAEEKMLIVDGYQRILTVYDYIVKKIFRTDGKLFKLSNSEKINKRWRGRAFDELSETEQRKIRTTTIHSIIFVQIHPKNDSSMYQIFERINTTGRTLLPQEIRNCVYHGKFNALLIELNNNQDWRKLYGLELEDSRMRDMEFILRFFALSEKKWNTKSNSTISLKKFLNDFMGDDQSKDSTILEQRKEIFLKAVDVVLENFGEDAFQNLSKTDPTKSAGKFNPTIFDSVMIATALAIKEDRAKQKDLKNKRNILLENKEYQELVRFRTTNEDRIAKRISLALKTLYGLEYE